ncbi:MAG TPA: D-glycerate dehydrogenase, partial [Ignavibacteria bacterium]|nr:D-glycerate dehydrogenase [Ignavibacteria bacterium]
IYHSRSVNKKMGKDLNAKKTSLNKLLKISDFISLHVPSNERTYHLLNKDNLKLLKSNAVIINTARGNIIDEIELVKILKKGKIFSAGLDVYENEPKIHPELLKLKNVVLAPHIGSATIEARTAMAMLAAKNVVNVLKGKKPLTPI